MGRCRDSTRDDEETAALLYNELGWRRGSLADCMIAVAALSGGADLASANARDFRPLRDFGVTIVR